VNAVKLSVNVGNMSTEDGRSEKRSRRNESANKKPGKEGKTESVTIIT
jgi:hypothetical protein